MVALNKHIYHKFDNLEDSVRYLTEEVFCKGLELDNMVLTTSGLVLEVRANSASAWANSTKGPRYVKNTEIGDITSKCLLYLEDFTTTRTNTKGGAKHLIEFNTRSPFINNNKTN